MLSDEEILVEMALEPYLTGEI